MDPNVLNLIKGAAGAAGGDETKYVEEVFSTYVYPGDDVNTPEGRDIPNGIDLDGKGGMVWIKNRTTGHDHVVFDTERGEDSLLHTNTTDVEDTSGGGIIDFNSDGFTIDNSSTPHINDQPDPMVSWTFRKAPGFFDVVTYTGDRGSSTTDPQIIPHSLACVPGMMIIREISGGAWYVYHKSTGNASNGYLDQAATFDTGTTVWNTTSPTSTHFTVGPHNGCNQTGQDYVAYLFADGDDAAAQIFGDGGNESIVKMGTYTGATGRHVELGFEPQFVMVKRTDSQNDWVIHDSMRTAPEELFANQVFPEVAESGFNIHSTGFNLSDSSGQFNDGSTPGTYIYIAIRRGPMKTPEDATEVFAIDTAGSTEPNPPGFTSGFPVDFALRRPWITSSNSWVAVSRLTGTKYLETDSTSDEADESTYKFDYMDGWYDYSSTQSAQYSWMFKRAPGFFDVVAFSTTGNNVAGEDVSHNLGVEPEMMIVKTRTQADNWYVYHKGPGSTHVLRMQLDYAADDVDWAWNDTTPTELVFTIGDNLTEHTNDHIAYLFASCPGVSKVGSKTVTGSEVSDIEITCEGFTSGARFVLIKRTDAAGDWYVYDSTRGIASGNDDFLLLNEPDAQDSNDYIDPLTTGFKINSSLPAGNYIYLAIA